VADPEVSALVVLRPRDGSGFTGREQVTSETIERYLPAPEAVSEATAFFEAAGFDVSPTVGISFSIAGPQSLFEEAFGERLVHGSQGSVETLRTARGSLELALDRLPPEVAGHLEAVTFTPPPDFGPTNP
jgi:hypothetical protein